MPGITNTAWEPASVVTPFDREEAEMGEKLDKAKGRAKTVAGAATGNERLEAEGHLDQAEGKVKKALKGAKKSVKKKTR
jgi:uncharacterized protein YjbJ (UPF0337 family)